MTNLEPPNGFGLRPRRRLTAETLHARPTAEWRRKLRVLLDAGGDTQWIEPAKAEFTGGDVGALLDRGALLVAVNGTRKRYLLTDYGVRVARGTAR
jgi:hypothetical protein